MLKKNQKVIVAVDGEEVRGIIRYVAPQTFTFRHTADINRPQQAVFIAVEIDGWVRPFFDTDILNFVGEDGKILLKQ